MKNIIIALTGGPGVGKSSVIEELAKRGYSVVPEVFTLLYEEAKAKNTLSTVFSNRTTLREILLDRQAKLEAALNDTRGFIFLDRSAIDSIAIDAYHAVAVSDTLRKEIKKIHIDVVFFLDPLPEQYYKQTEIRRETYEEAMKIHAFLKKFYKDLGYMSINVPFDTVEKRADFILDAIFTMYLKQEKL